MAAGKKCVCAVVDGPAHHPSHQPLPFLTPLLLSPPPSTCCMHSGGAASRVLLGVCTALACLTWRLVPLLAERRRHLQQMAVAHNLLRHRRVRGAGWGGLAGRISTAGMMVMMSARRPFEASACRIALPQGPAAMTPYVAPYVLSCF